MATSKSYMEFILEQLSDVAGITCRAMMGEYILYVDGKIFGGIYDGRLLVKPVQAARDYLKDAPEEAPYEGAKPMLLVEDVDDREKLAGLVRAMEDYLPRPRKK